MISQSKADSWPDHITAIHMFQSVFNVDCLICEKGIAYRGEKGKEWENKINDFVAKHQHPDPDPPRPK